MSLIVGVDDYSSESDVIIIPSALDFVSQDEMLTPLGRLDKYAASENIFNRYAFSMQTLHLNQIWLELICMKYKWLKNPEGLYTVLQFPLLLFADIPPTYRERNISDNGQRFPYLLSNCFRASWTLLLIGPHPSSGFVGGNTGVEDNSKLYPEL